MGPEKHKFRRRPPIPNSERLDRKKKNGYHYPSWPACCFARRCRDVLGIAWGPTDQPTIYQCFHSTACLDYTHLVGQFGFLLGGEFAAGAAAEPF